MTVPGPNFISHMPGTDPSMVRLHFTVFVARPRILLYRDFRSVVDARRALSVAGRAKGTFD